VLCICQNSYIHNLINVSTCSFTHFLHESVCVSFYYFSRQKNVCKIWIMYVVGSRRDNCNIKKVRTVEKKFICKIINQIFFFVYLETTFIPLACLLLHFQQSCTYFHSSLANNIIVFLFPHLCSIASFSICVGFWFQFTLYCRIHILPCICFFVLL